MGRRRTLPNINASDWGIRMQAERQAVNFVVQGKMTVGAVLFYSWWPGICYLFC